MSKEQRFEYESFQDTQSIVQYLEALVEGFKNKRIAFSSDNKEIVFNPEDVVKFEVKAVSKEDKARIGIKVSWKTQKKSLNGAMSIDS